MPTKGECGKPFSVDHFLNCLKEGFSTLRHNEVRDLTASLLIPQSYPKTCFRRHEQAKRRQYGQCIKEVEHAFFSPLVFSTSGGDGQVNINYLQETCSPNLIEERWVLKQCHLCAPVSPWFCPCQITDHVPRRKQILPISEWCAFSHVDCAMCDWGMYPSEFNYIWMFCCILLWTV